MQPQNTPAQQRTVLCVRPHGNETLKKLASHEFKHEDDILRRLVHVKKLDNLRVAADAPQDVDFLAKALSAAFLLVKDLMH